MTKLPLLAVVLSICTTTAFAAESDESPFPTVGKSYDITLAENARVLMFFSWNQRVKILKNGGDGWYYIEYSAKPPQPVGGPPPPPIAMKRWLNFRHVVSADEVKTEPEAGH